MLLQARTMPHGQESLKIYPSSENKNLNFIDLFDINNSKIGTAILVMNSENNAAYLQSIDIVEQYRKQQYGTLLMLKIFEFCQQKQIENLYLYSDTANNPTVDNFYLKLGFTYLYSLDLSKYNFAINIPDAIIKHQELLHQWSQIAWEKPGTSIDKSQLSENELTAEFDENELYELINSVEFLPEATDNNLPTNSAAQTEQASQIEAELSYSFP